MKKLLVIFLKFVVACSGPAFILYGIKLFDDYFATGTQSRDETHTVLINNHGAYRYITESQDLHFRFFLVIGALGLLALFVLIIVTKIRNR